MEKKGSEKLQFRIDLILTVLFIMMIFYFLIGTIVFEEGLWGRMVYKHYVGQFLEDRYNYTPMEWIEASKNSLDHFISTKLHGTKFLGKVNSTFQYALGKKLVSTGGTQMLRLNTGHLYDLQNEVDMAPGRDQILAVQNIVPEDTPFIFAYEHPTLYDEKAQMPAGYEFMDFSGQEADEVIEMLRENGVDVIDSREVLRATGLPLEDYLMYTDQHWATRAAMIMAQTICERAEERTGVAMPTERLNIDQFEAEVHPKLFMGRYGQRVGTLSIDPDDITVYIPKYDTHIQRHLCYRNEFFDTEGTFDEVCLDRSTLEPDPGKSWNIRAYTDYGLTEDYEIFTNEDGADCSILLLKDSFSAPIGRFLSLVSNKVYSVDLRSYYSGTLSQWLEECDPDVVVVAYSLQMLRNDVVEFE